MKILVPFDGSRDGLCTIQLVASMALVPGSQITVLQVVNPGTTLMSLVDPSSEPIRYQEIIAERSKHLTDIIHELSIWQPHCRIDFKISFGNVTEEILKNANDMASDLIVIAAHDRSMIKRVFLSSVSSSVLNNAERPVLVVKPTNDVALGRMGNLGYRVMVPIDNSINSFDTIEWLSSQAWRMGTKFKLLHVIPEFKNLLRQHEVPEDLEVLHQQWMRVKERTIAMIENHAMKLANVVGAENIEIDVRPGVPKHEILAVEKEWCPDIIAMGSHLQPGVRRILTRSVSGHVARNSSCAALIVCHQNGSVPKPKKKKKVKSEFMPRESERQELRPHSLANMG
jgi:nucleotide-binding universal stress UspA family protein